jgi:TatD DNase family protein
MGLHPWYISEKECSRQMKMVSKTVADKRVLAIGETGLDKLAETGFNLQKKIFQQHIEIAEEHNKPLIIHAVKTFNEIITLKKESRSNIPWIIHGFNGKIQLADMLIQHGFYLSFGQALMSKNPTIHKSIAKVPYDRFFLETDDSEYRIIDIYEKAAVGLHIDLASLKRQLAINFRKVFLRNEE